MLKKWIFQNIGRILMNRNVEKIRQNHDISAKDMSSFSRTEK